MRSALLDASRTPELAISTQAQGWIKQLTGTVDSEMMNAARSKPGLEPKYHAANNRWTQLQEDFNNPRSPLFQAMQQPDPSKIPQLITQRGQTGGSPYNAQLLDRYGIPKGPVKWAVLNDLANKDLVAPQSIEIRRDFPFNDSEALAKENEEALLFRDMRKDAVQQILSRLSAVKLT